MRAWWLCVLTLLGVASCGQHETIKIGFIGGTSGRGADLGIAGRNAVQLAVDQVNQRGGIGGRKVELLIRDDEQRPEQARRRYRELTDAHVRGVIGPMTSSMCQAVLPLANDSRTLTVTPTCTANDFAGLDDYLIRVVATARVFATLAARYHYEHFGVRKAAIVLDHGNKVFTESWAGDFQSSFESLGGKLGARINFVSGDNASLAAAAAAALAASPDVVVLVANAVDAALLVREIRKRSPAIRITSSEWAASERFIELAGAAAEGIVMSQFFDRESVYAGYLAFRRAYLDRFGEEPGFGSIAAHDAATVLFGALARAGDGDLKAVTMAIREFPGLQNTIALDASGDATREMVFTEVRGGRFVTVRRR